jgi:hypothetical protein
MRWKVQVIAETAPRERMEEEIATIEARGLAVSRDRRLTIAEGKVILEGLQKRVVAAQVQHHGASIKSCLKCGAAFRIKGYLVDGYFEVVGFASRERLSVRL